MTATNGSAKSRDSSAKGKGLLSGHWSRGSRGEADRRAGKPPGEKRQALLARASRLQASPANGPTKTNPGRWSGLLSLGKDKASGPGREGTQGFADGKNHHFNIPSNRPDSNLPFLLFSTTFVHAFEPSSLASIVAHLITCQKSLCA